MFLVLAFSLFLPGIVTGKVLSPGDVLQFAPPFSPAESERPNNDALSDAAFVFEPDQLLVREALRSGHLPLWVTDRSAGRPLLAAQQSAPFFPLNWIAYVFPYWQSLAWIALLKLTLAATGTFLLCRTLALGRAPALTAGIAYGFGFYLIVWLDHPQSNAFAMLQWLFLAA